MRKLVQAVVISGLAISAGPLSLESRAQGYIDLEAERATSTRPDNASSGTAPATESASPYSSSQPATVVADPYSTAPAAAYPATSYGVNSAAAPAGPALNAPTAGSSPGGSQNLGNLFYQLQQLQQEVMMLNGKVEEQAHELRKLRAQNLERYVDIDRRLGERSDGGGVAVVPTNGNGSAAGISGKAVTNNGGSSVAELPGEGEAYRAAYALVRNQQFDQAVAGFKQFLQDYPGGKYSPNAYYWLGELYLVITPADLESSRQAFMLLLDQYPNNSKIPDAMYKLGKVQFTKGNRDKAKEFFDRVIREYGSSNSSAVKLAQDFLRENY
ncbi:MAG: tol-pal system protein YbgF [Halioglobus sp.]